MARTRRVWTTAEEDKLREVYSDYFNREIGEIIGDPSLTQVQIVQKAGALGLLKDIDKLKARSKILFKTIVRKPRGKVEKKTQRNVVRGSTDLEFGEGNLDDVESIEPRAAKQKARVYPELREESEEAYMERYYSDSFDALLSDTDGKQSANTHRGTRY